MLGPGLFGWLSQLHSRDILVGDKPDRGPGYHTGDDGQDDKARVDAPVAAAGGCGDGHGEVFGMLSYATTEEGARQAGSLRVARGIRLVGVVAAPQGEVVITLAAHGLLCQLGVLRASVSPLLIDQPVQVP